MPSLISNGWKDPHPLTNLTCDLNFGSSPQINACLRCTSQPWAAISSLGCYSRSAVGSNGICTGIKQALLSLTMDLGCRVGTGPKPPFVGQTRCASQDWNQWLQCASASPLLAFPSLSCFWKFPWHNAEQNCRVLKKKKKRPAGGGGHKTQPVSEHGWKLLCHQTLTVLMSCLLPVYFLNSLYELP